MLEQHGTKLRVTSLNPLSLEVIPNMASGKAAAGKYDGFCPNLEIEEAGS